jgi:hypothetical protein
MTTGRNVELSLDEQGRLVLATPDGSRHVGVEPVRAFPLSEPGRWVSICDPEGRELLCLESLDALPEGSRKLLEEELSLREFVPVIQRIVGVTGDSTPSDWDVETDRGPTRFTLDSEDDVRALGPYRVLISDSRKLRFHIPDTRALDASSRRILDRYL